MTECTLTNEELIEKAQEWVHSLAKHGGRSWSLQVPVNFNKDPDMLFLELCSRLKAATTWIPIKDHLPDELQECIFIIDLPHDHRHGRVYGGVYTGDPLNQHRKSEFSMPGITYPASHWMAAPKGTKK